jgi:hypothetical protein
MGHQIGDAGYEVKISTFNLEISSVVYIMKYKM